MDWVGNIHFQLSTSIQIINHFITIICISPTRTPTVVPIIYG